MSAAAMSERTIAADEAETVAEALLVIPCAEVESPETAEEECAEGGEDTCPVAPAETPDDDTVDTVETDATEAACGAWVAD